MDREMVWGKETRDKESRTKIILLGNMGHALKSP